jgi:hypothetical protein
MLKTLQNGWVVNLPLRIICSLGPCARDLREPCARDLREPCARDLRGPCARDLREPRARQPEPGLPRTKCRTHKTCPEQGRRSLRFACRSGLNNNV